MERKVYIILGLISLISPSIIFILLNVCWYEVILGSLATFLSYVLVYFLGMLIFGAIKGGNIPEIGNDILFFFMPLTLGRKEIYYSEIGYFYISLNDDDEIKVYKQTIFNSKFLFELYYNGDNDDLRARIKSKLDYHYKEYLEAKQRKDNLKNWDGYIDSQSKRDDKLNNILK